MATVTTDTIEISDFSPGIHADYHFGAGATVASTQAGSILVPGAATVEGTYRCCADRSGALVPLPKLTAGPTSGRIPTAANGAAKYVTGRVASYLLDAIVLSDAYVEGEVVAANTDRAGVLTLYGQWYETDAFRWTVFARLHRLFDAAGGGQDLLFAKGDTSILASDTAKAHLGAGSFTMFRARESINSNFTFESVAFNVFGSPDYGLVEPAWVTGAISAGDQALTDFHTNNGATFPATASGRILGLFPDYDDIDTAKTKFLTIAGMTAAAYLTSHQGRLIALSRQHGEFGENTAGGTLGVITEHVHYTPEYDFDASLGIGDLEFGTFGERKPFPSGVAASVSADEFLLIKHRDGGLLVRGDLDNPTVVDLPFIHSTHGVRSVPAWSPLGLVYGTRNGIYVWEGGETTRQLSNQLEGFFWNPDADNIERYGTVGRLTWWEPWVAVPNNFLMDSRSGGWWRLDTPEATGAALSVYDQAPGSNRLYAFPHKLTADSGDPMWYTATPDELAASYSWKSQPLAQMRDRVISVKDIRLLVTNANDDPATVTVTLSGFSSTGGAVAPVATTVTVAGNSASRPQMLHTIVKGNFIASYIQVQIEATSGTTDAAPKVHSLTIGLSDRARVPNQ
jgi:hypothetical protein